MAFLKSVLYVMILGIVSHYIGETLPRKWFHWDRFPFRAWKWEKSGLIYEKIRIQNWKDRMPDISRVMKDMVPKRIGLRPTSRDIRILITETCVAETVHFCLCLLAPVIYTFWKNGTGVFLMIVVIACNLPFMMIQRYNRPVLITFAQRLEAREERKKNACVDFVSQYGGRT